MNLALAGTSAAERRILLRALGGAAAVGDSVHLDLSGLDSGEASKRRLQPSWWIPSLSNLLLGAYADLSLRVTLPQAGAIQVQLLRGGFYFSLAQRQGRTVIQALDATSSDYLEKSRETWNPRNTALFPIAEGTRTEGRLYQYANTHRRAEPGYFRQYQASAAFPWLGEALPDPADAPGHQLRQLFLASVGSSFVEVLDNISVHPFASLDPRFEAGWLGSEIGPRARSCLLGSVTKGGDRSHDRLHFLAMDNGFGIPRTLRWQHPSETRHLSADDLLQSVFTKRLTERGIPGHNGAGLWYLQETARFAGGTLSVLTEDDRSDGRSAVRFMMTVNRDGKIKTTKSIELIPIRGTIIHSQLEVPRVGDADLETISARLRNATAFRGRAQASAGE